MQACCTPLWTGISFTVYMYSSRLTLQSDRLVKLALFEIVRYDPMDFQAHCFFVRMVAVGRIVVLMPFRKVCWLYSSAWAERISRVTGRHDM